MKQWTKKQSKNKIEQQIRNKKSEGILSPKPKTQDHDVFTALQTSYSTFKKNTENKMNFKYNTIPLKVNIA